MIFFKLIYLEPHQEKRQGGFDDTQENDENAKRKKSIYIIYMYLYIFMIMRASMNIMFNFV